MAFLPPHPYAVHYQTQPPLLRGLVLRPLLTLEFTEACEMLLAMAQRYQCSYWLLDGRANESTRPTDVYQWLVKEFLPQVPRALKQIPHVAFVAQASFWDALQTRSYPLSNPALAAPAFHIGWFTEDDDAEAWLNLSRSTPNLVFQ
ncbi:hypothetical protein IC235_06740 [Hymenobacter sp. BT664]|uniref:STAS/SEC14 domain-containing protein n=1 Tax=Hymenobacter montanus TaxID=2771359 RepID=A0A927BBC8_9BACT|nr:hypothetical protein [Hymenobacter montanus]MBD2767586.1 hypothetical protein [Hymenobacter montanus]